MFEGWNRYEIVECLYEAKVNVRGSRELKIDQLRFLAETAFQGKKEPVRPEVISYEEFQRRTKAALTIQKFWADYKSGAFRTIWAKAAKGKGLFKSAFGAVKSHYTFLLGQARENVQGRFGKWNRFELVQIILDYGVELRRESALSDSKLRLLARELYQDEDRDPPKPAPWTFDQFKLFNEKATKLQKHYRAKRQLQLMRKAIRTRILDPFLNPNGIGNEEGADGSGKWDPPDHEKALKFREMNTPLDNNGGKFRWCHTTTGRHCSLGGCGEQLDMWHEGKYSEFGAYGPGVTNYFKFIKWGYWLLLVIFIIEMPIILLNSQGTEVTDEGAAGLDRLVLTMIGNLDNTYNSSVAGITIPGCDNTDFNVDCRLSKRDVAGIYAWLEVLASLVIMIALLWLHIFELKEEALDDYTLFASKYTVAVTGLPKEIDEKELSDFMESQVQGSKVATVFFAFDNEAEIKSAKYAGRMDRRETRSLLELRYYEHEMDLQGGSVDLTTKKRLEKAKLKEEKEREAIEAKIAMNEEKRAGQDGQDYRPVKAFVTFEDADMADECRNVFDSIDVVANKSLLLKDKNLNVSRAPEPSTIIWEHQGYRYWDKFRRKIVTTLIMGSVLMLSYMISFGGRATQQSAKNAGGTGNCEDISNGGKLSDLPEGTLKARAEADPEYLHCYCDIPAYASDSFCAEYREEAQIAIVITMICSMVIVANQTFIELMGNRLVRFEKHHSLEGAEISLFTRLSIGKFINYGLIFLLNEDYFGIASSLLGLEYVAPIGFSLSWYNTVGPSVVLTNIFDIFGSHGMKAATYTISLLERWESYRDPLLALDQQSLNKIYLGMQFTLGSRYANLYSAFFIAMIFGPSIPLVTIFVAMNFFITYWFEKYAFVNLYRVPPRYTTALGRWSTQLMPFAIAGRLIFSLWCLSDDRIFFNGSYGEFQALPEAEAGFNLIAFAGKGANFGLFFLLIGFATVWTCYELYDNPYFYYGRVAIDYVFWRIVKRYKEALEDAHGLGRTVTYAEAVATHKFKNLHSYNILHNPLYQEAFHITDALAASGHSRISDIKAYHTHRNEIHRSQTRSVDSGEGSGDTGNKPGSDGKKGRNFGSGSTSTEANKNFSSLASMEEDNRRRQRDEQERTKEMRAKIRMEAKAKEEKIKQQIISQGPASLTREQKEMLVILNEDLNEDENHLPRPPDNV